MLTVAVLVSGSGSNLQAIIDACEAGTINARVVSVISNRDDAYGLERAQRAGIDTAVVRPADFPDRTAWELALGDAVEAASAQLVVLAGFMRVLSEEFVSRFEGRILNIHPSLLPAYKGLDTHRRAIEDGAEEHGATVHFVTASLDDGPIAAQARVPVFPGDTPEILQQRVLTEEHRIYPQAIGWYADGRITFEHPTPQ